MKGLHGFHLLLYYLLLEKDLQRLICSLDTKQSSRRAPIPYPEVERSTESRNLVSINIINTSYNMAEQNKLVKTITDPAALVGLTAGEDY